MLGHVPRGSKPPELGQPELENVTSKQEAVGRKKMGILGKICFSCKLQSRVARTGIFVFWQQLGWAGRVFPRLLRHVRRWLAEGRARVWVPEVAPGASVVPGWCPAPLLPCKETFR